MSVERDALMFGRRVFLARRRLGLSQAKLAQRAGLNLDGVHKVELGKRSPRLTTVLALADALEVDPRELFRGLRRQAQPGWPSNALPRSRASG